MGMKPEMKNRTYTYMVFHMFAVGWIHAVQQYKDSRQARARGHNITCVHLSLAAISCGHACLSGFARRMAGWSPVSKLQVCLE